MKHTYFDNTLFNHEGVACHVYEGTYTAKHSHDGLWEACFITKGKVWQVLNGQKILMQEGDLYFMRPKDVHYFVTYPGSTSSHCAFFIKKEKLKVIADGLCEGLYEDLLSQETPVSTHISESVYARILNMQHRIFILPTIDLKGQATLVKMLISQLLYQYYANTHFVSANIPEIINVVIKLMSSKEFIGSRITEICEQVNYSHMQLSRLFNKYMHVTMVDYFKSIKLDHACNLLVSTNFTMLVISNTIGFSSLSHFNREFKAKYNMTPSEYRKQNQNTSEKKL